jgi:WD40 repeat protein
MLIKEWGRLRAHTLPRLFISHSSKNDDWAIALKDWLVREGWSASDDIFLDLDPDRGIAAGQRWVHSLEDAATRCEAVLFLVSEDWLTSKWCADEYQLANRLNKKLFALLIDEVAHDRLPGGLTAQWQIVRLKGEPAERFLTVHPLTQHQSPVHIAEAALKSLKRGLQQAGIGAETFDLQPDQNGPFGWRTPYRGLEALEPEDAAVFFGRDADIVRGIDELRGFAAHKPPRLLVILGASGAGKSSFLRAGLWPRLLRDDSQWLPLRAIRASRGGAIEGSEGLLAVLEDVHRRFGVQATRADLRVRLTTPDSFVSLLQELRKAAAKRALISEPPYPLPVICLDQGEEVFAGSAAHESEKFLQLARGAIDQDAALLLVTIRSDSYGVMQGAKPLAGIHQESLSLEPVPHGEIAHVIREPAELLRRKAGPAAPLFDAAVIERLQQEIEGEEDALPLLAFVLQRLMREHQGLPTIGLDELDRTGGVAAAIESAAEAALDDSGIGRDRARQREALRRLFIPRLARIDRESKTPQRRVAQQSELPTDLLSLAQALTQRRLLVVKAAVRVESEANADGPTLEVAHEALLRRWPTLADLLAEDRDALLLLDGVLSAAADWDKAEEARKSDYLAHRGSRLSDAQALPARGPDWQREIAPAHAYLAACAAREEAERQAKEAALAREQRNLRRARWALGIVFLLVMSVLAAALRGSYQASKQEAAVFSSASISAARTESCEGALRFGIASLPPARGASPLSYYWQGYADNLSIYASASDCYFQLAFVGHTTEVNSATFSPDGTRVLTASSDRTARVWDVRTGATLLVLRGHTSLLWSAAFSPDGKRILTASGDNTARLWDASTGAALVTLSGHTKAVLTASFSPDGSRIVTTSWDDTARVWDATTGALIATLGGPNLIGIYSAAFSPDGTRIVTAHADYTARVWDAQTGAELLKLSGHKELLHSAAFSPDGSRIVTASADRTARIWDAATGATLAVLSGHTGAVVAAVFSPDGSRIVTASWDNTARLWDGKTGAVLAVLSGDTNWVVSAAFRPDSSRLVTASYDGTARLWDGKTGAAIGELVGHTAQVHTAVFSPDGGKIVTAAQDGTARLWTLTRGAALVTLKGHEAMVVSAAFSSDGTRILTVSKWVSVLYSAGDEPTARLWDTTTGAELLKFKAESAALSPDGGSIVTADYDHIARVWDAKTGAAVATLTGHTDTINTLAFSPGSSRILTASDDKTARVWDAKTGAVLATLSGHTGKVNSAVFSSDGARIVTASADKTARLWDAKTGAALATLVGHAAEVHDAEFNRDDSRIVTASEDGTARLWDAQTAKSLMTLGQADLGPMKSAAFSPDNSRIVTVRTFRPAAQLWDAHTGSPLAFLARDSSAVNSAAFSPDSNRIITASSNQGARLWDARTGNLLATFVGHRGDVNDASFSPDGSRIVTASNDNTARIWKIDPVVLTPPEQRQEYVCHKRLIGAQSFSALEMQDPILDGREDLRNPCDRVGPLTFEYYWRGAQGLLATIRNVFAK